MRFERRLLQFSAQANEWLAAEAERIGISVPELVRRIVDERRMVHPLKA